MNNYEEKVTTHSFFFFLNHIRIIIKQADIQQKTANTITYYFHF